MDIVDTEQRSQMMGRIKSKNTKPELVLRRALHSRGFRFRLHVSHLPGSPDIVLPRHNVAIFVHGCFWHRHPGCVKAYIPKSNVERWTAKFLANVERDVRDVSLLQLRGWRVITVWECALATAKVNETVEWLENAIIRSTIIVQEWPNLKDTADETKVA